VTALHVLLQNGDAAEDHFAEAARGALLVFGGHVVLQKALVEKIGVAQLALHIVARVHLLVVENGV
jgi:flagellar biosynthesis/type III secretory pathway ATPase